MIYNTYGLTGIKLSAIGFGGMRFENPQDIDANADLVKMAYDRGINYFDTAPFYCDDKSEDIVGAALKEMLKTRAQKPFYVSTKSAQSKPEEVRKDIEKSLKRLGLDYIDFYYYWCIITMQDYHKRKSNGVLKQFEKLKEEGLIKHICISTHLTGTDIKDVLDDYPFDGILLGYSAMNFAYRDVGLDAAARLKRGVIVMNPLGGGLIPQHPQKFDFIKTRDNETVVEGALRFLINDPRITVSLVGFSKKEHLDEAISAVDGFESIAPEKISKIRSGIKNAFNELCTACRYCDECPEGIPIPRLMDAYNWYILTGQARDLVDRLRYHWGINLEEDYLEACNQCGKCQQACTQKLPILERFQVIRDEVERFLAKEKQEKQNQ